MKKLEDLKTWQLFFIVIGLQDFFDIFRKKSKIKYLMITRGKSIKYSINYSKIYGKKTNKVKQCNIKCQTEQ